MKYSLLLMLFVAFFSATIAGEKETKSSTDADKVQLTEIRGNILDKNTNEPLVGVKVTLGTGKVAYTDFDGKYSFENVKEGKYNLTASYISYDEKSVKNVHICLKNNQVDLKLETTN